jgi:hypothetical protein
VRQKYGGGVRCGYREPWAPICKAERPCHRHESLMCWCGDRANHGCQVAVSLVCGAPLCEIHHCRCDGHDYGAEEHAKGCKLCRPGEPCWRHR